MEKIILTAILAMTAACGSQADMKSGTKAPHQAQNATAAKTLSHASVITMSAADAKAIDALPQGDEFGTSPVNERMFFSRIGYDALGQFAASATFMPSKFGGASGPLLSAPANLEIRAQIRLQAQVTKPEVVKITLNHAYSPREAAPGGPQVHLGIECDGVVLAATQYELPRTGGFQNDTVALATDRIDAGTCKSALYAAIEIENLHDWQFGSLNVEADGK
jgi:hypothetical protein